jgi:hypothetical protein
MPITHKPEVKAIRTTQVRQRELVAKETPSVNLINNTGLTLTSSDVVLLDQTTDRAVTAAGILVGEPNPLVVLIGGAPAERIKCVVPGSGVVPVTCEGAAIGPGDTIIASTTPLRAKKLELEVAYGLLGIAISSKNVGAVASVSVILHW